MVRAGSWWYMGPRQRERTAKAHGVSTRKIREIAGLAKIDPDIVNRIANGDISLRGCLTNDYRHHPHHNDQQNPRRRQTTRALGNLLASLRARRLTRHQPRPAHSTGSIFKGILERIQPPAVRTGLGAMVSKLLVRASSFEFLAMKSAYERGGDPPNPRGSERKGSALRRRRPVTSLRSKYLRRGQGI